VLATVQRIERRIGGGEELGREIRMIRRNVELESSLIDDLLDVTRIAQGKIAIRRQPIDLHEKILHVLETCRPDINDRGIEIDTRLEAPEHFGEGDSARLQQVFWNVVKNAIKFTPSGGRVAVRTESAGPDRLRLTVADTGIGIPSEELASIFDAFEQGEATITRRFGGLGLGLAISKTLVEAHGGTIRAESDGAGRGATFVIELPAAAQSRAAAPPAEAAPRPGETRWSILVVEDHSDTAVAMKAALEDRDEDVRVAGDIEAAVAMHRERPADLLITDVGLPDGDGISLLAVLGQIHPLRGIVVSGYGMEADVRRSRDAGFATHLIKPFNISRLEEAIDQAMRAPAHDGVA
jgi:CheY-like chemotaxis protein/anti-sigma regulatory factor (Ser/Thr protein kinase)